jgi:hypothetical protein
MSSTTISSNDDTTISSNDDARPRTKCQHLLTPSIRPNDTLSNDDGEETRTRNDERTTEGEELGTKK